MYVCMYVLTLISVMFKIREGAKNSGGKIADLLPATGNTGKRQVYQPLVLGECTHRPEISIITLVTDLSGQTHRHQCRK